MPYLRLLLQVLDFLDEPLEVPLDLEHVGDLLEVSSNHEKIRRVSPKVAIVCIVICCHDILAFQNGPNNCLEEVDIHSLDSMKVILDLFFSKVMFEYRLICYS